MHTGWKEIINMTTGRTNTINSRDRASTTKEDTLFSSNVTGQVRMSTRDREEIPTVNRSTGKGITIKLKWCITLKCKEISSSNWQSFLVQKAFCII